MTTSSEPRQRVIKLPVSTPMEPDEIATVDKAAAIRSESRASYIRRVILREANADLREAERKSA
jgi:uncharacterized protein (DUF1778 family)